MGNFFYIITLHWVKSATEDNHRIFFTDNAIFVLLVCIRNACLFNRQYLLRCYFMCIKCDIKIKTKICKFKFEIEINMYHGHIVVCLVNKQKGAPNECAYEIGQY